MIYRGLVGSCLVLLGGLLSAVVPESSWLGRLAETVPGLGTSAARAVGVGVAVAGMALLAASWLRLVRWAGAPGAAGPAERLALGRWAAAVWSLPLLVAPPLFSRDGWSYAAQGEMARLGVSPYVTGPGVLTGQIVEAVDPRWMATPAPYGPIPLAWGSAWAHLTADPWLLVIAHRLLALVGVVLLGYALPRLATWSRKDPARVTALVLPSPLVLAHGVAGLHNDMLLAGVLAVALVVGHERGWAWGGLVAGVAAAVKLPGGLACIGIALLSLPAAASWWQRTQRLAATGAVAVASLLGVGALTRLGFGWIHALGVPGQVDTPLSMSTQLGRLLELVVDLGGGAPGGVDPLPVVRMLGVVAALVVVAALALRAPTGSREDAVLTTGLALLATVLLSPAVQYWYALWFVPLLVTVQLAQRWRQVLLLTLMVLGLIAPLDGTLAGAYATITLFAGVAVAVAVALLRQHRRALASTVVSA